MVLDRDPRYVAANATYLRVTGSQLDQLLGKYVFDQFSNDPADPNNLPARMLRRSLERVVETGQRDHLALIPYRVPHEVDGKIVVEDRFCSAAHSPILDGDGRVARLRLPSAPRTRSPKSWSNRAALSRRRS